MATRYFKKYSPGTPAIITLSGIPTPLTFDTLDHVLGWYGTENEAVQNELARLIREQRGGVSEISAEEYHEHYAQKKMTGEQSPLTPWREELSRSAGLGLVNREVVARAGSETLDALAVNGKSDIRRSAMTVADSPPEAPKPANPAKAPELQEFKPTLGKRNTANVPRTNKNRSAA
jgi:hypothetical protein